MSYNYLITNERGILETLLSLGFSHRKIAAEIGRHHSCISREVQHDKSLDKYDEEVAENGYKFRRKNSKLKGKVSEELAALIEEKLSATWLPEQIALIP